MKHFSRNSLATLSLLLAIMLVTAACSAPPEAGRVRSSVAEAMSAGSDQPFARATEPKEFVFPRDHGPHEAFRTEWWYYTGNLENEAGDLFGYQLTFFRSALTPERIQRVSDLAVNQIYMAHFAVTDGKERQHYSFERYARGDGALAGATGEPIYEVWLEDWEASEFEPGKTRLQANGWSEESGEVAIDLLLEQTTPPILHGDRGLSQKGTEIGNANYYYSLPRLETTGTITLDDRLETVTGLSWMDHEYGTSALSAETRGWDWFSIQLSNGVNIMLGELHDGTGGNRFIMEGSLVLPDGSRVGLTDERFDLQALEEWTSPTTGITYPARWQLTLPEQALDLTITPIIPDQEMDISFVYYEGATEVTGTMAGEPVQGRGYVELTGYGDRELAEYQR